MNALAIFWRSVRRIFIEVAVVIILFYLPLDVFFRINSWALFMSPWEMVSNVGMMVLVLSAVIFVVALLFGGLGSILANLPFGSREEFAERVAALVSVGALVIFTLLSLRLAKTWLQQVTEIVISVGNRKHLVTSIVLAIIVLWVWKVGILAWGRASHFYLSRGRVLLLMLMVSAVLVVAANGKIRLHDYNEVTVNSLPTPRSGMPNVILLSLDSLTTEDMSLYGYRLLTTPLLDAFAKESYVFDNFFSSSNWTTPSVSSFISGLYPITTGTNQFYGYFLEKDRKNNLAQLLTNDGYQTAAIVQNAFAHPLTLKISDSFSAVTEPPVASSMKNFFHYELLRMKDFLVGWWILELAQPFVDVPTSLSPGNTIWPPELAFDRAMPFLTTLKQPNFIWAHIIPPHEPSIPVAPFRYQFGGFHEFPNPNEWGVTYPIAQQKNVDQMRLRYDEFILDTDSRVDKFLNKLKMMGRFDDSIIIVTADHGQSFTKGWVGHCGPHLYQPLIHVPLMIHLPRQKEGKHIPFYAGEVDLLPTVLALLDLPIPKWAEGESLKAAMLEGKPTAQPKFSMNLDSDSRFKPPTKGTIAVMQDGWKLVRHLTTGKEELYHLAVDSDEATDLSARNPEQVKKMRELIYTRFTLGR